MELEIIKILNDYINNNLEAKMTLIEFAQEIVNDYKYEIIHNNGFSGLVTAKRLRLVTK